MILPALLLVGLLYFTTALLDHDQQQLRRRELQANDAKFYHIHEKASAYTPSSLVLLEKEAKDQIMNKKPQRDNKDIVVGLDNIRNNNRNDLTKVALAADIVQKKEPFNSIYHYYKKCNFYHSIEDLMILYWDSNGQLDPILSMKDRRGWWNGNFTYDQLTNQGYRRYGTMALLLNTDILKGLPYDSVKPPVPILFYTIYNGLHNSSSYKVIPTNMDKYGHSSHSIKMSRRGAAAIPYHEKKNQLVWRGSYKGEPVRARILSKSSEPYMDVSSDPKHKMSIYNMSRDYKYQLDVGGVSGTAWGGFRWKLCSGNLVFKIETFSRDWWYDYVQPWKHYIPVKDDLSNLHERYEWAESHPQDAYEIAQAGAKVCMETYEPSFVHQFEADVIQSIPPLSKELYDELNLIREGYLTLSLGH